MFIRNNNKKPNENDLKYMHDFTFLLNVKPNENENDLKYMHDCTFLLNVELRLTWISNNIPSSVSSLT